MCYYNDIKERKAIIEERGIRKRSGYCYNRKHKRLIIGRREPRKGTSI